MLEITHLGFDYADVPILSAVNFSLNRGELLHLRGENGAGKTTLLKLLAGILSPSDGEIRYQGDSIANNMASYQENLCYVGHKLGISQILTVRENCAYDLKLDERRAFLLENVIDDFSLSHVRDTPCNFLSAGLKRRVALLRLVLSDVSLWLLDEPFVALDQKALAKLQLCMKNHLEKGGSVILSSHKQFPLSEINYQEYCL